MARAAFEKLYRAHAPGVHRRARMLLKSEDDASEVVQELFLKFYERPELLAGKKSLTAFLYATATHACLNRLRNDKNRMRLLRERGAYAERGEPSRAEILGALRDVIARMPEPLGQLAIYYHFDELTHEEIASLLDCSRRQVGNLLLRLEQWLKRQEVHENPY